ncbi:translation initiation factor IF-2 [bacterium]|nr:translation initiation factor IF-2 [bacterium]
MKVRIHQVAKDLDKTAKEILEVLEELGVEDVKSHQSSIDESLVPKIKQRLSAHKKETHGHHKVEAKAEPKKEHKTTHKVEPKTHKVEHKTTAKVESKTEHKPKVEHKAKTEHKPKAKEETIVKEEVKPKKKAASHTHREPAHAETAVAVAEPEVEEAITPAEPSISEEELERLTAPEAETVAPIPEVPLRPRIHISENIAVKDLALKLNVMSKILLKKLLDRGILANLNQSLDLKLAEQLADEFGFDIEVRSYEEVVAREQEGEETEASQSRRPPVVTIMGHVDHGKTSLLDAIRESNVAGGESGGITQHIGAYSVSVNQRGITFIDTPGHEAFTRMRARGALVTDIVVLVVAADDGVMPQTLEAIDHAKAAKVPIVVAINKMDKPDANPDRIKQQLSQHGILIEEYGGETVCVEISARKKTNIDTLLEMILLVADILELKASPGRLSTGTILEAKLDKSRGPVGTVLVQNGTLHVGDVFVAGAVMGRVRAMFNDMGHKMRESLPGEPIEVLGFQGVPQAGDSFQVFKDEFKARSIVAFRQSKARELATQAGSRLSLDQLFNKIQQGEIRELPIIIKADVQGSLEVLSDTLTKLGTSEVKIKIIHSGTGAITLSDVLLAEASNAIIIGYNVRPEPKARELAEKEKVDIRTHTVIYNITAEIRSALEGLLQPTIKEVFLGSAEVRDTFRIPKVGTIAGCYVSSGKITRSASVRLVRDHVVTYEGKISSLKRFKDDASEVKEGFECGVGIENYNDIKVGDTIEAFTTEKVARQLQ